MALAQSVDDLEPAKSEGLSRSQTVSVAIMKHSRPPLCLTLLLLALIVPLPCRPAALSTTHDGRFQAIAQGPTSVALYWKTEAPVSAIYRDGAPVADLVTTVDGTSGFTTTTVGSLHPDTLCTFSLGKDGPTVSEKTWCEVPDMSYYDLLIIGGSASGVSAAITAARLGMRVALIEETNRVGGMASNGLGATDMRKMSRSNGFFEDFRRRIVEFYGEGEGRFYESRVANAIFKDMLYAHPNIDLYLKSEAIEPIVNRKTVRGAVVKSNVTGKTGRILAQITIDATVTADFSAAAGAQFRVGREPRTDAEPHAGVLYFNNARQEILPGSTGEGDNKQQSYAYLMTWKDYGPGGAPLIEKPRFYDPETFRHSPEWAKTWNATSGKLPNDKYEINQHPFGIDWPDINHDYPTASAERRREIEAMYRDRALGYLYYFQNEKGMTNLGLADDEFLDSGNFPPTLYVREARRIMGEYLFQENDVTNATEIFRGDSIGIGDYPMDSHATEDLKDPTAEHKGEGEAWLVKFTPVYQVPYGVVVPKGIEGLLVSTAASGTHWGYGTLRMEPVRFALGQAAAAAAYWSILYSRSPREIRASWVQDKILSQYAYLRWNSDVTRDTRHFQGINFLSARGIFVNEALEPDSPISREHALVAINRLLKEEGFPRGLEVSPVPSPDAPTTRGQFAMWLVDAKQKSPDKWEVVAPERPSYSDVPRDSAYYTAVETLKARRISAMLFADAELGLFKPDEPITRGDAAMALYLAHRAYAMNYWLP